MMRTNRVPLAAALGSAAVVGGAWFIAGWPAAIVVGVSAAVAFVAWLLTSYRRPILARRVLGPFLVLIVVQLVHLAEEEIADFPGELRELADLPATFDRLTFTVGLVVGANVAALAAVWRLRSGSETAKFLVWFYVVGLGFVNAVLHVALPVFAGRPYFPGLATVALPTAASIVVASRLLAGLSERPTRRTGQP